MPPSISIIIPIYNSEKFIDRCLNSILEQEFKDYIVYMINDGSNDGTLHKLELFSKKDNRFIVINKDNSGVASTRNVGLSLVDSKYTIFIDSDDTVEPSFLQLLYNKAEVDNNDLTLCNYKVTLAESSIEIPHPFIQLEKDQLIRAMLEHQAWGVLWNKLIKTEIYKNNNLAFIDEVSMWEDLHFNIMLLINSNKIGYVPHSLYNYIMRRQGLVNSNMTKKRVGDQVAIISHLTKIDCIQGKFTNSLVYSKLYAKKNYLTDKRCFDPKEWRSALPTSLIEIYKSNINIKYKIIATLAKCKLDLVIWLLIRIF